MCIVMRNMEDLQAETHPLSDKAAGAAVESG